jgi:hypothetical protein
MGRGTVIAWCLGLGEMPEEQRGITTAAKRSPIWLTIHLASDSGLTSIVLRTVCW